MNLKKKNINWKRSKPTARFICSLTIFWPDNKFITVNGKAEGTISEFKKGNNGFGYDPIFEVKGTGKTFAEMDTDMKKSLGHRGIGFKKLIPDLEKVFEIESL